VSLARLDLLLRIVIPNVHPSVRRTSRDESPRSTVQRNRCHLAVCLDMAKQMPWLRSREEVDILARSHGNGTVRVVVQASVELTRGRRGGELEGGDSTAGAQVVPAQHLVLACGDEEVWVASPDDGLDRALVVACADLIRRAVASRSAIGGSVWVGGRSGGSGDVENAQLLVLSTSREDARALARREGHSAHDVRVVQGHESLAGECVPDFCAEVGAAGCCQCSVLGQPGAPDSTFVSDEGANPIAGQTVTQHWILVFACGDHVIGRAGGRVGGVQGGREA
jgi:hypothetical protein